MAVVVGAASVPLLEEDPELGVGLLPNEFEHARRLVMVPLVTAEVGPWNIATDRFEPTLGLLVLDGLLKVNVHLGDRIGSQLAGRGDVLHMGAPPDALLPGTVIHYVSERTRAAVLDRVFIAAVRRWPALLLALHERLRIQEHRLTVHAAIGKLRRVEDRILALGWHLAERWGRVTPQGVVVPITLTHETIGHLVGAERPTVTLALGELARTGELVRRDDGALILSEESRERLRPAVVEQPQPRPLALLPGGGLRSPAEGDSESPALMTDIARLRERIRTLHEDLREQTRSLDDLLEMSRRHAGHGHPGDR